MALQKNKFMRLLPKIPRGAEDENGFHLVDDPSRDYSFMDETRARIARERLTVCVVVIVAGVIAFGVLYFSK